MLFKLTFRIFHQRYPDAFEAVAVTGEEALSELFAFHVAFKVPVHDNGDAGEADTFAREVLGSRALLTVEGVNDPVLATDPHQYRYGMISAVHSSRVVGNADNRVLRVECTLVPRVYKMSFRKRSRVFQEMNVQQIVSVVLAEHQIAFRWALERKYPRRQYCLQYQETDLEFVTRLFADEGIAFYFEHRPSEQELRLLDTRREPSATTEEIVETVGNVIMGVGGVTSAGGGAFNQGWMSMGGGITSLIGDALRGPERDPDTVVEDTPGAGGADPTGELGDVLCFVDEPSGYVVRYPDEWRSLSNNPSVTLHLERVVGLASTGLEAWDFMPIRRTATTAVDVRDHDFRRPLLSLQAFDPAPNTAPTSVTGVTGSAMKGAVLEAYDHHGEHDPPYVTTPEARNRLQQYQADIHTAVGRTPCPRMMPGHVFQLDGAGMDGTETESSATPLIAPGRYATIRARHGWFTMGESAEALGWNGFAHRPGRTASHEQSSSLTTTVRATGQGQDYANEIECVPAGIMYRPHVQSRVPHATCETAIVVGPAGQEIHTDRHGRVKVQFHWDREGPWTAHSSAFLRVVQPWAGAGYGFQFIPRIGQEVLVTFLGGDPDRPVITGCLYDGTHPHPEPLPERATRSAIRTQSTPGGGGFNELVFEDAHDEERLTIRAQRTLEEVAKGPHSVTVGEDQRVLVSGDQQTGIVGEQRLDVGGGQSVSVGADRRDSVAGTATAHVGEHHLQRVEGTSVRTTGGLNIHVTEHDDIDVVHGSKSMTIRGNAMATVGGDTNAQGSALLNTTGPIFVNSERSITIQGLTTEGQQQSRIRLKVGDSQIVISQMGILIEGGIVSLVGTNRIALEGHGHLLELDDSGGNLDASPLKLTNSDGSSMKIEGGNITVASNSEVQVKSGAIKLKGGGGSGDSGSEEEQQEEVQDNVELELTHHTFTRTGSDDDPSFMATTFPDVPCRIVLDDGTWLRDKGVSRGTLKFHVPDEVKECTVHVLIDEMDSGADQDKMKALYPEGLQFLVKIAGLKQTIPAATSAEGKRVRLANLGYLTGAGRIEGDELDELTEAAIERFREREELLGAQNVDTATTTRIQKLLGEA